MHQINSKLQKRSKESGECQNKKKLNL